MCLREWLCLWLGWEFGAGKSWGVSVAGEGPVITESGAEPWAWSPAGGYLNSWPGCVSAT